MTHRHWQKPRHGRPEGIFRKVRADHAVETTEDYVEAVSDIVHRRGECRVKDLALHMGVSHVTVSRIVTRLLEARLVETRPYRPIRLTAEGERLAARSRRRHEIVYSFLLAHHVGGETLSRMAQFLNTPLATGGQS